MNQTLRCRMMALISNEKLNRAASKERSKGYVRVLSFHNGSEEVCALLGHDWVSQCYVCPTFRDGIVVSPFVHLHWLLHPWTWEKYSVSKHRAPVTQWLVVLPKSDEDMKCSYICVFSPHWTLQFFWYMNESTETSYGLDFILSSFKNNKCSEEWRASLVITVWARVECETGKKNSQDRGRVLLWSALWAAEE